MWKFLKIFPVSKRHPAKMEATVLMMVVVVTPAPALQGTVVPTVVKLTWMSVLQILAWMVPVSSRYIFTVCSYRYQDIYVLQCTEFRGVWYQEGLLKFHHHQPSQFCLLAGMLICSYAHIYNLFMKACRCDFSVGKLWFSRQMPVYSHEV